MAINSFLCLGREFVTRKAAILDDINMLNGFEDVYEMELDEKKNHYNKIS